MRKLAEKFLILILCAFNIFLATFSVSNNYKNYKGTDFLAKDNFGYVLNFGITIRRFVSHYGNITIKNGELDTDFEGTKVETLYDENDKKIFEISVTNLYDRDLENFFLSRYGKTEIYKNNHNANSITFALFGKTSMISYIYNPDKELRYTDYTSMIKGQFSSLDGFSFKDRFNTEELTTPSLHTLLLDVGESFKNNEKNSAIKKTLLYTIISFAFSISLLLIIKRRLSLADILLMEISVSFLCIIPYLLIRTIDYSILLIIGLVVGVIASLIWAKKEQNE